jgi:hypothetical protein
MFKLTVVLLLALFFSLPVAAQQDTFDYQIRSIRQGASTSPNEIVIQFEVVNAGATSQDEATVTLHVVSTGEEVASQSIPPLATDDEETITFSLPSADFEAGARVRFGVRIVPPGEDEDETPADEDYGATINFQIPQGTAAPTAVAGQPGTSVGIGGINVDLNNPLVVISIIGGAGVLLILIWVMTLILRLLFSRSPSFTTWQPPYLTNPMIDPNSVQGRRQLWQQHAQSDALTMPCIAGNFMVRKLLIGIDGRKLAGWRLTGMRVSQYDMYGRVARSETLLPSRVVKALDRAARKAPTDRQRAERMVRLAAQRTVDALLKQVKRRNLMLPIALDVRFRGAHGEVLIVFELHRCTGNSWQLVDQWEPEMIVVGGAIHENFTYTLYGQYSGETPKQFRQRLRADLTHMFASMVQHPLPAAPPAPEPIAQPPSPESMLDTAPVPAQLNDATTPNKAPPMIDAEEPSP